MGISGCNFAIAETGTVCIVTNEGNGRMTSSMPRLRGGDGHLVLVPHLLLTPSAISGTYPQRHWGSRTSVYLSMTSSPRKPAGDPGGSDEFHVILMDNGRTDMLANGYGEALMYPLWCMSECLPGLP